MSQCADCWSPAWWVVRGGCAEHMCSSRLVPKDQGRLQKVDVRKRMDSEGETLRQRGEGVEGKISGRKGLFKQGKEKTHI